MLPTTAETVSAPSAEQGIPEEITPPPASHPPEFIAARRALRYYYDNFDRYDMITYPLLYATSIAAEMDVVDIYRISPEDATRLIRDEKLRRRKLAGTSLSNFGAFFDERFRVNDILWGRLDCAERIITALLPISSDYEETKNRLIDEAHRAIIVEEFATADSWVRC